MLKVDQKIRWHYTTTVLRLRIGARLTRYRNCKFHNGCRTISRYSVPPSAGPLLPLYITITGSHTLWVDWYHQHAEVMIVSAQNCVLVPKTASTQHILCNAQQLNVRRSRNKPVLCSCIWNFFGRVIIKWRWWMWMVAAYRRTHSPSCLAWCEGWQPSGIESLFIKEPGELLQWLWVVMTAP